MNKNELKTILESWENLLLMVKLFGNDPEKYDVLMQVALYDSSPQSWRAAYLFDKINDNYPELILPYLEKIIRRLETETNSSKKRHFLKILSMKPVPEESYGFLVTYCLDTLSSEAPPAVRVHAMQILYNISETEKDLKPELLQVIEQEMEYRATAGIISRGRKIAAQLRRQIG